MSGKASLTNNLDELGIQLSDEEKAKVLERVVQLGDFEAGGYRGRSSLYHC